MKLLYNVRDETCKIHKYPKDYFLFGNVLQDWRKFVVERKETDLEQIIKDEKLKKEPARKFVDNAFRDGVLKTTGTDIDGILPPVSRFGGGGGNRASKKTSVIGKLKKFFDKYFGIFNPEEEKMNKVVYLNEDSIKQEEFGMVAEDDVKLEK